MIILLGDKRQVCVRSLSTDVGYSTMQWIRLVPAT